MGKTWERYGKDMEKIWKRHGKDIGIYAIDDVVVYYDGKNIVVAQVHPYKA